MISDEWPKFLQVVKAAGFKILENKPVISDRNNLVHNLICFNAADKLLLHATSIREKIETLDAVQVYGAFYSPDANFTLVHRRNNLHCQKPNSKGIVFFEFDARRGLIERLKDIRESVMLVDWPIGHPVPNVLDNVDRPTANKRLADNRAKWLIVKKQLEFVP